MKLTPSQKRIADEARMKIIDRLGKLGAVDESRAASWREVVNEVKVSHGEARRRYDELHPGSNISAQERGYLGQQIIAEEFTDLLIKDGHIKVTDDDRLCLGKPIRVGGKKYRPGQDVAMDVLQRDEAAAQRILDGGLEHLIAPMPDDRYRALVDGMRTHGYLAAYPILIDADTGEILDGHHRKRAALEVGVEPTTKIFKGSPLQKLMAVVMGNANRRHDPRAIRELSNELARQGIKWDQIVPALDTMEGSAELRDLRREYEQIRKDQGATQQEIADEVGVSQMQVSKDLKTKSENGFNDHETEAEPEPRSLLEPPPQVQKAPGAVQRQVSTNIRPEDWNAAKSKAQASGLTMADVVGRLIAGWLSGQYELPS